jgi:hypothetical protein
LEESLKTNVTILEEGFTTEKPSGPDGQNCDGLHSQPNIAENPGPEGQQRDGLHSHSSESIQRDGNELYITRDKNGQATLKAKHFIQQEGLKRGC